jgi:predicted acetyltransferase
MTSTLIKESSLSVRLNIENKERAYREYSLILNGEVIGEGIVRTRASCAIHWPARAASHIGYRIEERWRGQGYGSKWFRLLLEEARGMGLTVVVAAVDESNLVSRRIIEANGGQLFDRVEADFPLLMYRINLDGCMGLRAPLEPPGSALDYKRREGA